MKKYSALLVIILGAAFSVHSQTTEINGVSKKKKPTSVKLFQVVSGGLKELASTMPSANGTFAFKFEPSYEGYYAIGTGNAHELTRKFKLYVKGDDKINLELNDSTYVLVGANNKENQILAAWQKLIHPIERRSVYFIPRHFQGFFPQLENLVLKSKTWLVGKASGNAAFDQLMKTTVDYDLAYLALTFISSSTASQPDPADYNPYLKNFKSDPLLKNAKLLQFPYGAILLKNLVSFKNKNLRDPKFDSDVMSITNDTLKGVYVTTKASTLQSYTAFKNMVNQYEKYILTKDQKMQVEQYEITLAKFRPGADAINFAYPDVSGKMVSLADFKGKIVFVDIWATWCGPCIKEIPYLKSLEKEFHGKDVVFLSISVDVEKDKEKWKKFIADEQLGGVQLFANGGSSPISRSYNISGIPRFMLFDKNGKIIDVDSPRPSDPKLKEILIENLK